MFEVPRGATREQIDSFVNDLIEGLSLEEKVYMMSGHGYFDRAGDEDQPWGARTYQAGAGNERLGIPTLQFSDGPRGIVTKNSTCFPVSMARGASWDVGLEERIGEAIGKELRAHGGNLYGGVCINLLRHPAWGRAQETYGEDPFLLGEMGAALVRGVQRHNVIATAKHFAANSIENARLKVNVRMSERVLREVYLPHFKRCVDEGVGSIMSAYNKVNGAYCGHNGPLLRTILKEEWRFEGFVHSDWVKGVHGSDAAAAGLDIENPDAIHFGDGLVEAVKDGRVPEEAVNEAVLRILRTLLRFLSAEDPQTYDMGLVACAEHRALAREAAEKGSVLLKNEGGVLPLDKAAIGRLAVFGRLAGKPNLGDRGSSQVRPPYVITPLEGLRKYLEGAAEVAYEGEATPERAAALAGNADAAVVVVGLSSRDEGEYISSEFVSPEGQEDESFSSIGGDRDTLTLDPPDEDLLLAVSRANPRTIVVLMGGSAILMERWRRQVPAILMIWYPGMEGGAALARMLFGEGAPTGKLPFTIPQSAGHLPYFDKDAREIEYDLWHGYSKLERDGNAPAFAFGFGLSYTEFSYGEARVSCDAQGVEVSVAVTNTGSRAGWEVVQLYIGFENAEIERPRKLLKGFSRVALDAGATTVVNIAVSREDLAWYNQAAKRWEVESIEYSAHIGGSSKEEDLQTLSFSFPS